MGIFSDDFEPVYDIVIEHKLRQTVLEEANPKLIKDCLKQRKVISQSLCVSSGVAFSRNDDCKKSLRFCESFRLRRIRHVEYVKADFYII